MVISVTFFKNQYDNKTDKRLDFENFDKFSKFLYKLSKRPLKGKKDAELISPAIYESGTKRRNVNVLAWAGWAAVDVDDHTFSSNIEEELRNTIGHWKYLVYSTASSRVSHPKFRIVFETSRHIKSEEIRHFWFALQSAIDENGDKQCKDLSRMYYIPAEYSGSNNFIFSNDGSPIDVDDLLLQYPYVEKKHSNNFMDRLPEEMQKKIIEYRKETMDNTGYHWTSYEDCPFVNKKLIQEYRNIAYVDNSGRYAMIYKIMVSIASSAVKKQYPINADQLTDLIRQLDRDTSNRYENRALTVEADRAIEYAYRNA